MEKAEFRKKLRDLSATGKIDDALFADTIYTAVSAFGVSEQTFRSAFGLSQGAVERWTQMKNLPQPTVRAKILGWLEGQI